MNLPMTAAVEKMLRRKRTAVRRVLLLDGKLLLIAGKLSLIR